MKFADPVFEAKFIKRYKRFFADIEIDGQVVTAHVPNTGSMITCLDKDAPCIVTHNNDPKRKLKYTLQLIKSEGTWTGVNTHLTNQIVWEAIETKIIPHWANFDFAQREIKINDKSRIDFILWKEQQYENKKLKLDDLNKASFHFVEVKNVTLKNGTQALFPDSVTTRGQKHIQELVNLIDQGHTAELAFVVQREGCTSFSPALDIDPEYSKLLKQAHKDGLKISILGTNLSKEGVFIDPSQNFTLNL